VRVLVVFAYELGMFLSNIAYELGKNFLVLAYVFGKSVSLQSEKQIDARCFQERLLNNCANGAKEVPTNLLLFEGQGKWGRALL
jgi:hypothetical protein